MPSGCGKSSWGRKGVGSQIAVDSVCWNAFALAAMTALDTLNDFKNVPPSPERSALATPADSNTVGT